MLRVLFSLLLCLAVAADAAAQTAPASTTISTTKITATNKTTTSRATAKPRRTTIRKTATQKLGATNTTAQPVAEPAFDAASSAPARANGDGGNVYAAPGMPVNVDSPKKVGDYNGDPVGKPARPKRGNTLTPR